ncbi:MAG: hypothetical protein JKX87_02680 [Cycloclasticus sp.]|nr:hypothetical protein [Cycloclasticus sp.]
MKKFNQTLVLFTSLLVSSFAFAEVAVIVHPSNANAFDKAAIAKIFLGKKKSFPSGGSIITLTQDGALADEFNTKLLGKSSSQLKAYWAKLIFTGKAIPPKTVAEGEMLELVKSNPSTIGFIDGSKVTADVKVIGRY